MGSFFSVFLHTKRPWPLLENGRRRHQHCAGVETLSGEPTMWWLTVLDYVTLRTAGVRKEEPGRVLIATSTW